jgi:hypothetical protein
MALLLKMRVQIMNLSTAKSVGTWQVVSGTIAIFAICFIGLQLTGCKSACQELADNICACEMTAAARQTCEVRVKADAESKSPSDAEEKACEGLIDQCSCDKLAAGDYQACGLAP